MRLLTLAALAAIVLSAQNAPTPKAEKPTDRPLTNTEKMTLQLAHKSVLLFQEQYKVKEHQQALQDYQKAIAADQKTQYDTIISVCGSIGLTEKDLGQLGVLGGLGSGRQAPDRRERYGTRLEDPAGAPSRRAASGDAR